MNTHSEAHPSVLHELNAISKRLDKLLAQLRDEENADTDLRGVVRDLHAAVALEPNVALACVFLNQIAGTYAVRHCIETAIVVTMVAGAMRKPLKEMQSLTAAALTMNVGMLREHDSFQRKPGALEPHEMAIVHRHPERSAELLKSAGVTDEEWISCVLMHHENADGSGYPGGKTCDEVTQNARLLNLADRYCARVSSRNYRSSLLPDAALKKLTGDCSHDADPALSDYFHQVLGPFPPGCLVQLENGETGVVAHRDPASGMLEIHCLRDPAGNKVEVAMQRLSGQPGCAIHCALSEDDADLRFSMKQVWGALAAL
ncbi:HD-GYP domain-containing protein [Massilia endophytica]|uniref:HD-GYP domain-containing protein n=1 Tax=Massilia endophytica TaxID=2899220 RepID=UPI001E5F8DA6|nr:HD domain-containing phosphohydrolase [Massilia endophytica]UGQ48382.1 HD domain-containing protein [Massilia endophytica]